MDRRRVARRAKSGPENHEATISPATDSQPAPRCARAPAQIRSLPKVNSGSAGVAAGPVRTGPEPVDAHGRQPVVPSASNATSSNPLAANHARS